MFRKQYLHRSGGMGDVLWLEPVVRELTKKHKKVILHTKFKELFQNYPAANLKVTSIPPGWRRAILKIVNFLSTKTIYHKLDTCYETRPKMHILHAYQSYFGLQLSSEYPALHLADDEKKPLPGLPEKYVVLHLEPNATMNFRKVYGVNWEEVIAYLNSIQISVIITGNNPQLINGASIFKGSLRQLMQLIYNCMFFIGVDSGPAHIAASLKKPALIFFGSVNPLYRHFTESFKGFFLQQPCEFAGCYHEVINSGGQPCKLVGDAGIPKCCVHSTESIKNNIDLLITKYCTIETELF